MKSMQPSAADQWRRAIIRVPLFAGLMVTLLAGAALVTRPALRHDLAYRLTADNIGAPTGETALYTAETPDLRFAVAGDVGTADEHELLTASVMDLVEGNDEYDALLLLGDNVYPAGDPTKLHDAVFGPFDDVLDGDTKLLAVLGNHDVRSGNAESHALAIGMPARWYATRVGSVLIVSLDSTDPENPEQLAWLEATLAASDAPWTIAAMHHPAYSGGYHGSSLDVRAAFEPLFNRYGVQLVLAGHDHDYQRSVPINGATYVVSGGAATLRPANKASFTEVAWSTYHFLDIGVWADRIEVRAIDQSGGVFDTFEIDAIDSPA